MLDYMGMNDDSEKIQNAVFDIIKEGKGLTGDVGGKSTTHEYTDLICERI